MNTFWFQKQPFGFFEKELLVLKIDGKSSNHYNSLNGWVLNQNMEEDKWKCADIFIKPQRVSLKASLFQDFF